MSADTVVRQTQWRGQTDTTQRRFFALLGLSVLLHAPFTPMAALIGLLSLLGAPPEENGGPDLGELNAIPVSLLSSDELAQLGAEPPEPAEAEPAAAEAAEIDDDLDALFDDLDDDSGEPVPQATEPERDGGAEPSASDGGTLGDDDSGTGRDGGAVKGADEAAPIGDPVALAGAASSVTDPNANVRLLIFNDRIRGHQLAPRIGQLIARLPQWDSFFGPTTLDPIRDFDRIYVAGPQFKESAEVVGVLEYNVPQADMKKAIDGIVARPPKGQWLDGTKVPAARARADRAERTFVLPKPGIVVMVPPKLTQEAITKGPQLGFPKMKSEAAVVAFINTPWRVFIGFRTPVQIPKSIQKAMLLVLPTDDGGLRVRIEAVDESPDAAEKNAQLLERAINVATQQNVGVLGAILFGGETLKIIEPVKLSADGNVIRGTAVAKPRQADRILGFAESWLDSLDQRRRARAPKPPVKQKGKPKRPKPAPKKLAPKPPAARAAPSAR